MLLRLLTPEFVTFTKPLPSPKKLFANIVCDERELVKIPCAYIVLVVRVVFVIFVIVALQVTVRVVP
jgi:hypothetical protein